MKRQIKFELANHGRLKRATCDKSNLFLSLVKMRPSAVALGFVAFAVCCALGLYGHCQRDGEFKACEKTSKQCRREMMRSKRRNHKDQRLQAKKLAKAKR